MISKSGTASSGTPQIQPIIIIAIILFAFSGLMVGFAVGAFARTANSSTDNQNPIVAKRTTPTPTPTPVPTAPVVIRLGCPDLPSPTISTNPDGTLVYSVTITAKDKTGADSNGACHVPLEKTITANGITCRIWLVPTQDVNVTDDLIKDTDQLRHIETFNKPFPHEIQGALVFDPATPNGTQPCVQGSARWKFSISPSVPKGSYFLVGLTDWQGQSWNWSWSTIQVDKKQGS
jgi:hypothetical protein